MRKREIEGDWVLGWPDRKRPEIIPGKDAEGRVINGRAPVTELAGLITPTQAYYIVNQLEAPEPVHPDDWRLSVKGAVERPFELDLEGLMKFPGRGVRAVTECAGNDAGYFDYLTKGARKPSRINQQDMQKRAAQREQNAIPSTDEIGNESTTTCAMSAGEFTGVPLAEVLKKCGLKSGAVSVRMEGFDRGQPDLAVQYRSVGRSDFKLVDPGVINYEKGLPIAKALHPDTLLEWINTAAATLRTFAGQGPGTGIQWSPPLSGRKGGTFALGRERKGNVLQSKHWLAIADSVTGWRADFGPREADSLLRLLFRAATQSRLDTVAAADADDEKLDTQVALEHQPPPRWSESRWGASEDRGSSRLVVWSARLFVRHVDASWCRAADGAAG